MANYHSKRVLKRVVRNNPTNKGRGGSRENRETHATSDSSEITVLELSLSQQDRPVDGAKSEGRYLVRSDQLLDPAICKKDTL